MECLVARIPLAPNTTGFWFRTLISADSLLMVTVVIFFLEQARSGLDNLDSSIVGKVVAGAKCSRIFPDIRFDRNPAHVACYLNMVPGNVTCIRHWKYWKMTIPAIYVMRFLSWLGNMGVGRKDL